MIKDRHYLVATASTILTTLFAALLFPFFRCVVRWPLIVAACWLLLLVIGETVVVVLFRRALNRSTRESEWRPSLLSSEAHASGRGVFRDS